jgi:hypothetical protein
MINGSFLGRPASLLGSIGISSIDGLERGQGRRFAYDRGFSRYPSDVPRETIRQSEWQGAWLSRRQLPQADVRAHDPPGKWVLPGERRPQVPGFRSRANMQNNSTNPPLPYWVPGTCHTDWPAHDGYPDLTRSGFLPTLERNWDRLPLSSGSRGKQKRGPWPC